MNAPTTLETRSTTADGLTPELRAHFIELFDDLGILELEVKSGECKQQVAISSIEDGWGMRSWSVDDTEQVDLSPAEFDALLPFVDETGKTPITLHRRSENDRVEVQRDPSRGPDGWKTVGVQVTEHVTLKVLSLVIGDDIREALIRIEAAGEYTA